jgi:glycosyltransferase involved in cell wall biosynthesis
VNLVALVESEGHVCCRYRVAAFRAYLAAAGIRLTVRPLPASPLGRVMVYRQSQEADVVLLQRKLVSGFELALLRRWAARLVYDFDDAVWLRDSYSAKGFDNPGRARRFRRIAEVVDLLVAGNEYLAAEARRYAPADRVAVIPTCVEPGGYPVADHRDRGPVRLVWVGSASTLRGLERFRPTLERIGQTVPNVRLKLICDKFLTLEHLPVEPVRWAEGTEAAEIAAADIGIGWVPDDRWSRGKCGLKLLQYQAAGLPVVANPVGVQGLIVRHNESGLLAATTDDWVSAIRQLAADPNLRHAFGTAGRKQVETGYSVTAGGRQWVERLRRLVEGVGCSATSCESSAP